MNKFNLLGTAIAALAVTTSAIAQTWSPVLNVPTQLGNDGPSAPLLLHDGRVLIHGGDTTDWYTLTPSVRGSYINGTWTKVASTPAGYGPQYFASAVLQDGNVVIMGGEYNLTSSPVWTSMGAFYNTTTNAWTPINPPSGWSTIGDAQSIILPDGTFMMANIIYDEGGPAQPAAYLNEAALTWTPVGTGKADICDEEGWTLLPDGTVLTVNVWDPPGAQVYTKSTGAWTNTLPLPVVLTDGSPNFEIGPMVLMYSGKVFATGATNLTAIYDTTAKTWTQGPSFPAGIDVADGPSCCLPNGNVIVMASPGYGNLPATMYLYNGSTLTQTNGPPNITNGVDSSYYGNFLLLPSGQMMMTDFSPDIEIYNPAIGGQSAWRPTMTNVPAMVGAGNSYQISGTQLNGLTGGTAYGDDLQNATNYPMLRVINLVSNYQTFCRTGGYSTMGVATGSTVETCNVLIPTTVDSGPSQFQMLTNGLASTAFNVMVTNGMNNYSESSVSLTTSSIVGGNSTTGFALFSVPSKNAATVTLVSNNAAAVVPGTVTMAAGKTQIGFTITTKGVSTSTACMITATCLTVAKSATLTVTPAGLSSLTCGNSNNVMASGTAPIGVHLSGFAPTGGTVVSLKSSNTAVLTVPTSMTVAAGANTGTFNCTTLAAASPTAVTITGTFNSVNQAVTVSVSNTPIVTAVSFTTNPIAGGSSEGVVVTMQGRSSTSSTITLASNNTAVFAVPANMSILAEHYAGTINVTPTVVAASTAVLITATGTNGAASATVTVVPAALLSVGSTLTTLTGGASTTGTVTLTGFAPTGGDVVTLSSNNTFLTVPASATVAAGTSSMTFAIHTTDPSATQTVTVTAKFGTVTKTVTITVNH